MFNFFKKGETPAEVYKEECKRVYEDSYPLGEVENEATRVLKERLVASKSQRRAVTYPSYPPKR